MISHKALQCLQTNALYSYAVCTLFQKIRNRKQKVSPLIKSSRMNKVFIK